MIEFATESDDSGLRELVAKFPGAMERMMELVALELHGNVREESPVDQGKLAGAWQLQQLAPLSWGIGSDVEYRWPVHEGTKPHRIEPVTAKALHFVVGGQEIFCKYVDHPGTEANPYMDRAIEATEARLEEFADMAIEEVTGGTA